MEQICISKFDIIYAKNKNIKNYTMWFFYFDNYVNFALKDSRDFGEKHLT